MDSRPRPITLDETLTEIADLVDRTGIVVDALYKAVFGEHGDDLNVYRARMELYHARIDALSKVLGAVADDMTDRHIRRYLATKKR